MSNTEQRFALSMRQADDDEPGLIRERDGTVWLVNPDGTRTQLPGSGSGVPDGGSTGEVLTKASNADGDADWEAGGGSQPNALTLIGPFTVAFDTSNFINPVLPVNGAATLAIPAGTMVVSVIPITTAEFAGSVATDWMYVGLAIDPSGSGPLLGAWQLGSPDTPSIALGASHIADASISGGSVEAASVEFQGTPALAIDDCHLIAGFFPAGPISAGSLDLYAVIATPL